MNPRDKHLLEVFKDLGEGEAPPPGPSVAPPAAEPRAARPPRSGVRRLSPEGRLGLFFGLAVLAALFVGYSFGSGDGEGDAVRAADTSQEDPLAFLGDTQAAPKAAIESPVEDSTAQVFADVAELLADESNRYTVVAITYDNNPNNERLAWSTVNHFAERGLPVGPPYGRGGLLYILVGASPTVKELSPLRDRVRVQLDPGGRRGQYESAYVSRIDQVISER